MRPRRFRYLITFVAAMFLANDVAAAAYACLAGLDGLAPVAALQPDHTDAGHPERAADADALCLAQCVKSDRDPPQQFAASGSDPVAVAAYSEPCLPVRIEPAGAGIAWALQAAAPPRHILFCNLRI